MTFVFVLLAARIQRQRMWHLSDTAAPACARPFRDGEPLPKRRGLFKASTALVGLTLLSAGLGLLGTTVAVMAEGGGGGLPPPYAATPGGHDSATAAGGAGSSSVVYGAGGGGAGSTGGAGGHTIGQTIILGGAGGTTPGAAGGNGGSTTLVGQSGSGGGGGAHGSVGSGLPGGAVGGNGGNGGSATWVSDGGGGGGAGGWGAVITGTGALGTLFSAVTGGNGGNGGDGGFSGGGGGSGGHGLALTGGAGTSLDTSADLRGGRGGNGGSSTSSLIFLIGGHAGGAGGHGLLVTGAATVALYQNVIGGDGGTGGNSINGGGGAGGAGGAGVSATNGAVIIVDDGVQGGNGGAGGTGTVTGAAGAGGTGIVGNNVTITMTTGGGIAGGLSGDGIRGYALLLSGDSKLTIMRAGTANLFGGIQLVSGTLTLDQANGVDITIANVISGAGGLRKTGTGTVTLTDANTYTGGTTIAGGTLQIGNGGTTGSILGDVVNHGRLVFNRSNSLGFNGAISGTGGLTKTGAGTLTLTGTNSYSGATTVEAGTLLIDAARAMSAASDYSVATGAQLQVSDGLGAVSAGSLAGAGNIQIGTGTTLKAGGSNASTTFSGSISGNGGLDKTGTGTLTLTGTNTYTGGTTVSGGKLVVNGSITSTVTLAGGTLGGSGTLGGMSVASGGTVAPGNSIGTLNVSGNVSFASGSTYQVEVNAAGQSDRIAASGSASITGGTVQVLAENGNYAAATSYTILTASGGVTGQFSTVTSNLAFLTPSLSYGGTDVTLTMTRNDTGFGPGDGGGTTPGGGGTSGGGTSGGSGGTSSNYIAATRNQGFIANAAEALGAGNPVYDALISATAAEARAGFDLLSGEAHAQAVSVMIDESRLVRDTILGHLRGPLLTPAPGQVAASFSADLPGRKGEVVMPAPQPQPRYAFWGEAFGSAGNTDADGNAASLSRRSGGALLGADLMLYEAPGSSLKVGVAGGYSQSRFDLDARLSSGKLESGHAALYAGARFGSLRFDAGAAYSWSESDIRRQVAIRGFGDLLRLQRPGSVLQGFAELGYGFAFTGFALEPFAQLALLRVSTDAGTEQGGAAALRVLSSDQTLGFTTLGLRAEAQIGTMPLFARAMLGWRHGFGELTPQARTAFALGTSPAVVFAAPIDRNALTAEAGLDWRISQATALGLTYSAAIGERSRDHALKGRIDMRF